MSDERATGRSLTAATAADETLDALLRGRMRLLQPRRGPRVSLDSLLLAHFARATGRGRLGRVLDLGCGTGAVGIALALADPEATVVGVELQPRLVDLAQRNADLNGVAARVRALAGDLRHPPRLPVAPGRFDVAVANPPFRPQTSSRRPPRADRALARQEIACTLADVIEAARRFLGPRGRAVVVFPADRTVQLLGELASAGLAPRVLRAVHSVAGEPARRVLVEAARGFRGGLTVTPPLVVHAADRRAYTPEAARILGD